MITPPNLAAALGRFPDLVRPDHIPSILSKIPRNSALQHTAWTASDIKDGAHELRQAARDAGTRLSHGHALQIASAAYGFLSWNAALGSLGRREDIEIPNTIDAVRRGFEQISHCSPTVLHGNFPGLANSLLHPDASKDRLPEPVTDFNGRFLSWDYDSPTMLVLSHNAMDLTRLRARYPLNYVMFPYMSFFDAIWQALRLSVNTFILDRPNAQGSVSYDTFRMVYQAHISGHNMIIATDAPDALPDFNAYLDAPERAYKAFLKA